MDHSVGELTAAQMEKGHRSGLFTPPVAFWSSLVAHSGGARYDDPDDNSYCLSYDDTLLVKGGRWNSDYGESLVGL